MTNLLSFFKKESHTIPTFVKTWTWAMITYMTFQAWMVAFHPERILDPNASDDKIGNMENILRKTCYLFAHRQFGMATIGFAALKKDCIYFFSSFFAFRAATNTIDAMGSHWYDGNALDGAMFMLQAAIDAYCFSLCWDQAYPKGDKDKDANWKKENHMLRGFTKCWLYWSLFLASTFAVTQIWTPGQIYNSDQFIVRSGILWQDKISLLNASRDIVFALMVAYALYREGEQARFAEAALMYLFNGCILGLLTTPLYFAQNNMVEVYTTLVFAAIYIPLCGYALNKVHKAIHSQGNSDCYKSKKVHQAIQRQGSSAKVSIENV